MLNAARHADASFATPSAYAPIVLAALAALSAFPAAGEEIFRRGEFGGRCAASVFKPRKMMLALPPSVPAVAAADV